MAEDKKYGLKAHWKCMLACILVSMSPFQYGIDFGLIGPMQAMIGFLKVSTMELLRKMDDIDHSCRFLATKTLVLLSATILALARSS